MKTGEGIRFDVLGTRIIGIVNREHWRHKEREDSLEFRKSGK